MIPLKRGNPWHLCACHHIFYSIIFSLFFSVLVSGESWWARLMPLTIVYTVMFLLDQITQAFFQETHPLGADGTKMQVVCLPVCVSVAVCVWERESERGKERERAAHKQGLQSIPASINQLRKERVEFAYPPPVWEAESEEREGGAGSAARSLDMDGKGWEGDFPKKRKRSRFLNGLNRTRPREEETVGEEVVWEEGGVWDFLK